MGSTIRKQIIIVSTPVLIIVTVIVSIIFIKNLLKEEVDAQCGSNRKECNFFPFSGAADQHKCRQKKWRNRDESEHLDCFYINYLAS